MTNESDYIIKSNLVTSELNTSDRIENTLIEELIGLSDLLKIKVSLLKMKIVNTRRFLVNNLLQVYLVKIVNLPLEAKHQQLVNHQKKVNRPCLFKMFQIGTFFL